MDYAKWVSSACYISEFGDVMPNLFDHSLSFDNAPFSEYLDHRYFHILPYLAIKDHLFVVIDDEIWYADIDTPNHAYVNDVCFFKLTHNYNLVFGNAPLTPKALFNIPADFEVYLLGTYEKPSIFIIDLITPTTPIRTDSPEYVETAFATDLRKIPNEPKLVGWAYILQERRTCVISNYVGKITADTYNTRNWQFHFRRDF